MAVSISAMFKLVDKMSENLERIGSTGNKALSNIEKSSTKADETFTKCQSSASKLSAVYQNFEGNVEQLSKAVQRGEKNLSNMNETAASTFEYSTKLDAATEAQERLQSALSNADKAAQNYETVINDSSSTTEDFTAAQEELDAATRELFEAFDKGAEAALDLDEASDKAAEGVDKFGKESEEAAQKGEEFGEKTSNAIQSVEQLLVAAGITKLLSEITESLFECAEAAETLEYSSAKLETLAGSQNMDMLKDQLFTISTATGEAQEGLYEVAYNAISAGTEIGKAAEITGAATKLATAGFTSSSSALSVLTTATNSYGEAAGTATDITDGLITVQNLGVTTVGELANSMGKSISTASAYNVSLNNLESAYISVTKAGINTQEGTTYINAMITELGKSSSEVAKILREETGKSFGELMEAGYSLGDVLSIVYEKAGRNSEAMMNMFGSQTAAVAASAIINQGIENFNGNLKELQNSAGATSKAYSIMANTTEFSHNKMKNSSENLKVAIGEQLNPILSKFYDNASRILDKATAYIQQNPWLVKAITSFTVALTAFVGVVITAKVAVIAFNAVMNANPILLAVSAIAALTAGFVALAASISAANEEERREQLTATSQAQKDKLEELNAEYEKFKGTSAETSEEANRLRYQIDDLSDSFENNKRTVGELEDSIEQNANEVSESIAQYKKSIEAIEAQESSVFGLIQKLKDLVDTNDNTAASEGKIKSVIAELNELLPGLSLNYEQVTRNVDGYVEMMKKAAKAKFSSDKQEASLKAHAELQGKLEENQRNYNDALAEYCSNLEEVRKATGREDITASNAKLAVEDLLKGIPKDYDTSDNSMFDKLVVARNSLEDINSQIKEIEDEWAKEEEAATDAWENPLSAANAASNILDKYKDSIEELCNKYAEAYNAAYESFQGQFGLFDEASTKSDEYLQSTVANAQAALDSQLEYWQAYNENISQLKDITAEDLGLTKEQYDAFMAHIQDGSEEAAGLAQSMVDNINNGNEGAVEQLAQTFAKVDEQQQKAADTVADWKTDFYNQLNEIENKMKDCVEEMKLDEEAKSSAKFTIEAYAASLRNNMGTAVAAASDVAAAVNNALNFAGRAAHIVSSTNSSGGYASGTEYASPGVHLVGENGPELLLFRGGEEVIPNDKTEEILSRSNGLEDSIPESITDLPTVTYSDSSNDKSEEKTINLNINGQGNLKIGSSMSKDEMVEVLYEYAKPVLMSIIEDEIIEEGEDSYEY